MAKPDLYLHWGDYLVFAFVLLVSMGIGLYHACTGNKQRTTSEYLVANRKMSIIPVSFSYVATFMSATFLLGIPAEMYVYGFTYMFKFFSIPLSNIFIVLIAVPLFHPLKLTSSYEYLERRFNSVAVRKMGAAFGIILNILYMGVVIYGPAIVLDTVVDFPVWASVFVVGIVAMIYTSIGGIRAVIWTDVFQFVILLTGLIAVLVKSTIEVGGFGNFWKHNTEYKRLDINWSFDPTVRTTFWNSFLAGGFGWFALSFTQSSVQRIAAMPTQSHAIKMILLSTPGFVILSVAACLQGFAGFAYYTDKQCDPFAAKYIRSSNQLLPHFVMELFQSLPGLSGLFMAAIFSASMSTLSSGLNALTANTLLDFVTPFWPKLSEFKRTIIAKILVFVYGFICIGISFLVMKVRGPVTQIATSLLSSIGGPMTGLFLAGAFLPWTNSKGALLGGLCGLAMCMWITVGAQFAKIRTPWLPLGETDECPLNATLSMATSNSTLGVSLTTVKTPETRVGLERMYALSFLTYSLVGTFVTIIVTMIGSLVTGLTKPRDVNPLYLSHLIRRFFFSKEEIAEAFAKEKSGGVQMVQMNGQKQAGIGEDGNGTCGVYKKMDDFGAETGGSENKTHQNGDLSSNIDGPPVKQGENGYPVKQPQE